MLLNPTESDPLQVYPGNPNLCSALIEQMRDRPIPFAVFMEQALYHPDWGYYVTQAPKIGPSGDFYTSPHLSPEFGTCMARQLINCWENLGQPDRFDIVEMGAGQGIWAADILRAIARLSPQCDEAVSYTIVEQSVSLQLVQQQHLSDWEKSGKIQWRSWDEIPSASIRGCFISNELVDAFPVHRVTVKDGRLQELYVTWSGDRFETLVDELSTPRLSQYFENLGLDLCGIPNAEGYQTEVNLNAIDWITTVADRLSQGYVITIDYGHPANRYYSFVRREGTLACYFQHRISDTPYENVGLQDLTAHVEFTTLEHYGKTLGLDPCGLTQQAMFLMCLGLGETIAALSQTETQNIQEINDRLRQREALHRLINPTSLGNFLVLIQSKALTLPDATHSASHSPASHALLGLTIPGH
jgi:SAM-dependent MidA family methyltransferase